MSRKNETITNIVVEPTPHAIFLLFFLEKNAERRNGKNLQRVSANGTRIVRMSTVPQSILIFS